MTRVVPFFLWLSQHLVECNYLCTSGQPSVHYLQSLHHIETPSTGTGNAVVERRWEDHKPASGAHALEQEGTCLDSHPRACCPHHIYP